MVFRYLLLLNCQSVQSSTLKICQVFKRIFFFKTKQQRFSSTFFCRSSQMSPIFSRFRVIMRWKVLGSGFLKDQLHLWFNKDDKAFKPLKISHGSIKPHFWRKNYKRWLFFPKYSLTCQNRHSEIDADLRHWCVFWSATWRGILKMFMERIWFCKSPQFPLTHKYFVPIRGYITGRTEWS